MNKQQVADSTALVHKRTQQVAVTTYPVADSTDPIAVATARGIRCLPR